MIDPGHGGYDPGTESSAGRHGEGPRAANRDAAEGRSGSPRIRAELTRSTDVFISLAERTRIANSAGADLFVSIHLNSSPNADTTGIEVYYLNNTTDRATIRPRANGERWRRRLWRPGCLQLKLHPDRPASEL